MDAFNDAIKTIRDCVDNTDDFETLKNYYGHIKYDLLHWIFLSMHGYEEEGFEAWCVREKLEERMKCGCVPTEELLEDYGKKYDMYGNTLAAKEKGVVV